MRRPGTRSSALARIGLLICAAIVALWLLSICAPGSLGPWRAYAINRAGTVELHFQQLVMVRGPDLFLPGLERELADHTGKWRSGATKPCAWSALESYGFHLPRFLRMEPFGDIDIEPSEARVRYFLTYAEAPHWLLLLVAGTSTLILWRYGRRHIPAGFCQQCAYNLTGNVSGVCPECGTPTVQPSEGRA